MPTGPLWTARADAMIHPRHQSATHGAQTRSVIANAMKRKRKRSPPGPWDTQVVEALIDELWSLRKAMLERVRRLNRRLRAVDPAHRPSAVRSEEHTSELQSLRQLVC